MENENLIDKKNNRGGRRPGAGRPVGWRKNSGKVQVGFYVTPEERDFLRASLEALRANAKKVEQSS